MHIVCSFFFHLPLLTIFNLVQSSWTGLEVGSLQKWQGGSGVSKTLICSTPSLKGWRRIRGTSRWQPFLLELVLVLLLLLLSSFRMFFLLLSGGKSRISSAVGGLPTLHTQSRDLFLYRQQWLSVSSHFGIQKNTKWSQFGRAEKKCNLCCIINGMKLTPDWEVGQNKKTFDAKEGIEDDNESSLLCGRITNF